MDANVHYLLFLDVCLVRLHLPYCPASLKCRVYFRLYQERYVSTYVIFVRDYQAMEYIGRKSTKSSSENTYSEYPTKEIAMRGDYEDIVKVPMTDKAAAIFAENGGVANFPVFDVDNFHHAILFVISKQIDYLYIPPNDIGLSHTTSLLLSFRRFGSHYSGPTLFVTFLPEASAEDVTRLSTGVVTVGRWVLKNSAKAPSLDGHHCLKKMRQLHMKAAIVWVQQHILVHLIA